MQTSFSFSTFTVNQVLCDPFLIHKWSVKSSFSKINVCKQVVTLHLKNDKYLKKAIVCESC